MLLHVIYGTFLLPFMQTHPSAKLLEVGSGCNQDYGPGARKPLWKKLFPTAAFWEASLSTTCEGETKQVGLQKWLDSMVGDLHVVIHSQNHHQQTPAWTVFDSLWPRLRPGGMYFIEAFNDREAGISNRLAQWIDQLLIWAPSPSGAHAHPMPSGLESIYCQRQACMIRKQVCRRDLSDSGNFVAHTVYSFEQAAREMRQQTDKTTTHKYQVMFGTFLLPYLQSSPQAKMLEIGLGCGMVSGTGASARLWLKLFPSLDLWEAEYQATCVDYERKVGRLDGFRTVTGDQGDAATLQEWLITTGGNFDIIIDDGSHHNKHVKASFEGLWPAVRPGGLYFLEDLQVGREAEYADGPATSEIMQSWVQQMVNPANASGRFPLPPDVESVYCQWEACVVRKAGGF
ncbi:mycE [Symbiodinium necroappetens]|uniref:MycE protein n=1 Tax=Symbiodinium necroappetens TaxID=1628268 RepID=A0A812MJG1_9DINO|nr:mycE [Symbiodinium necroappetens]